MTLTLFIPRPPDIANGRKHWAAVARDKRALWNQLTVRAQTRHGFPTKPATPIAHASIGVTWHYLLPQHKPDPDNVIRRMKPVLDWLVMNGWLAGDSSEHVTLSTPVFVKGTAGMPKLTSVELTLTPGN